MGINSQWIDSFNSRESLLKGEQKAIRREKPKHNKHFNKDVEDEWDLIDA